MLGRGALRADFPPVDLGFLPPVLVRDVVDVRAISYTSFPLHFSSYEIANISLVAGSQGCGVLGNWWMRVREKVEPNER